MGRKLNRFSAFTQVGFFLITLFWSGSVFSLEPDGESEVDPSRFKPLSSDYEGVKESHDLLQREWLELKPRLVKQAREIESDPENVYRGKTNPILVNGKEPIETHLVWLLKNMRYGESVEEDGVPVGGDIEDEDSEKVLGLDADEFHKMEYVEFVALLEPKEKVREGGIQTTGNLVGFRKKTYNHLGLHTGRVEYEDYSIAEIRRGSIALLRISRVMFGVELSVDVIKIGIDGEHVSRNVARPGQSPLYALEPTKAQKIRLDFMRWQTFGTETYGSLPFRVQYVDRWRLVKTPGSEIYDAIRGTEGRTVENHPNDGHPIDVIVADTFYEKGSRKVGGSIFGGGEEVFEWEAGGVSNMYPVSEKEELLDEDRIPLPKPMEATLEDILERRKADIEDLEYWIGHYNGDGYIKETRRRSYIDKLIEILKYQTQDPRFMKVLKGDFPEVYDQLFDVFRHGAEGQYALSVTLRGGRGLRFFKTPEAAEIIQMLEAKNKGYLKIPKYRNLFDGV